MATIDSDVTQRQRIMISDNQLDQYFQFLKDVLLEEVSSAYYVIQNVPIPFM